MVVEALNDWVNVSVRPTDGTEVSQTEPLTWSEVRGLLKSLHLTSLVFLALPEPGVFLCFQFNSVKSSYFCSEDEDGAMSGNAQVFFCDLLFPIITRQNPIYVICPHFHSGTQGWFDSFYYFYLPRNIEHRQILPVCYNPVLDYFKEFRHKCE